METTNDSIEIVITVRGGYVENVETNPPVNFSYTIIDYDIDVDEPDVDEYQENQDFAQDGEFENMGAEDIL